MSKASELFFEVSEINSNKGAFFKSIHSTKKHIKKSREVYDGLCKRAYSGKEDVWPILYNLEEENEEHGPIFGKDIIKSLRHHLSANQHNRCCYCRRWLYNIAHARPIEHILARVHYPQFSLEYLNFAVACYDCNQIKKASNWENLDTKIGEYPLPNEFKTSFHPSYHRYDGHIKYVRTEANHFTHSVYVGITPQGKQLCINLLSRISAMEILYSKNDEFTNDLKKIQSATDEMNEDRIKEIETCISEIYRRLSSQI
jgi:uncharacterized protein (TIGR02646 family)